MKADRIGVHRTHCCILHGCKYGDSDCPVVNAQVKQDYTCEDCDYDYLFKVQTPYSNDWSRRNIDSSNNLEFSKINKAFNKKSRQLKLNKIKSI